MAAPPHTGIHRRKDADRGSAGPDRGHWLAGVLAFEDPVRDGVAAAIGTCLTAGIHTIMVTGDHPATARPWLGKSA